LSIFSFNEISILSLWVTNSEHIMYWTQWHILRSHPDRFKLCYSCCCCCSCYHCLCQYIKSEVSMLVLTWIGFFYIDTVQPERWLPRFRSNMLLSSSGQKSSYCEDTA
jgi:hypothetical protein